MSDPSSFANVHEVVSKSLELKLRADFDKKTLEGEVTIAFTVVKEGAKELVLDTRDLTVFAVTDANGKNLEHTFGTASEAFGKALHIALPAAHTTLGPLHSVTVRYATSPSASAIQWLSPSQTAGKTHPYLFTQCQAIHARSLVPCQDAAGFKVTYTARVTVPKPLTALMSAPPPPPPVEGNQECVSGEGGSNKKARTDQHTFSFSQTIPISTYLLALAIGELEFRQIGERTRVWSEPSMIEACASEFAETEKILKVAEDVAGEYRWGTYGLLVLPPSFPYGGMENPCLTFVTPTLLAGDRSLVDVVAHEIAHSWTGNLVSCQDWTHFWLNEGFTVFLERKIVERLHGREAQHFAARLGLKHLVDDLDVFGHDSKLTHLCPDLTGIDPDDAFSSVPYEKGFNFLVYLETLVGGPTVFEPFLRQYLDAFAFKSVTSAQFRAFFTAHFTDKGLADAIAKVDWDKWLNTPGLPLVPNEFDDSLAKQCEALADKYARGEASSPKDTQGWKANQYMFLLDTLAVKHKTLSEATLRALDDTHAFTASGNAEIKFRWYMLCVASDYEAANDAVVEFLAAQGRMKYVRPLYRQLFNSKRFKELAVSTFQRLRPSYHSIAAKMIARDLKLDN